ncbi:DNA helicase II [Piscirickettsia salmonis]|uniref:DNA helicase II n=1 Tax=Piscirickettsia salmonis TaxID=1238 RepID=UPI0012BAEFA5|nr:DNA helicase II [Piscirickettsia salmonis]
MMNYDFCDGLNAKQREAVMAAEQDMLVLAGAGSGKTRVLIARIAWLVAELACSPREILALTFTNKAALEMRERLNRLLALPAQALWMGTFHGICHKILRRHSQAAHLPDSFQIIDADDQLRLIRRLLKVSELDEKQFPPRQLQWFINHQKDQGLRAHHVKAVGRQDRQMLVIYQHYEAACQQSGLVDFAEILLRVFELLKHDAVIFDHYQTRFRHVLVDEFQDTNSLQYELLKLISQKPGNYLTVIGDDDQSIYGWRGACVKHIQDFQRNHVGAVIVRLEQNYRSSANILAAANAVIEPNNDRIGKNLWTEQAEGELISVYSAFNETDEARFIAREVKVLREQGVPCREVAVLYRSNAQSRVIEEAFLQEGLAYRIYGGQRFFDRAEIKDALAYLRLVQRRDDDSAFERIINTPTRGIGDRTVQLLRDQAKLHDGSLWQALCQAIKLDTFVPARATLALKRFYELIEDLAKCVESTSLATHVEMMLERVQLDQAYIKEGKERHQARLENLSELVSAGAEYERYGEQDESVSPLQNFLAYTALESGELQAGPSEDCIQMMTLHMAKGLEFSHVMLCGMEEGIFPHQMSMNDPERLPEERRLCYVGVTRAMKKLYISHAEARRLHGREAYHQPSRFLGDIPVHLTEDVRFQTTVLKPQIVKSSSLSQPQSQSRQFKKGACARFRSGQAVAHKKFGSGVILDVQGDEPKLRLKISFKHFGVKWLLADFVERVA